MTSATPVKFTPKSMMCTPEAGVVTATAGIGSPARTGGVVSGCRGSSGASVTRAGFIVGGQGGNGALFGNDGRIAGFFQTAGASWGLQAGIQNFGYALFLMDNDAVRNLNRSGGWEVGSSPSLVVVDRGMASSTTTTTFNSGTYAFFFNQRGLMAGLGLHGTKITRIHPPR